MDFFGRVVLGCYDLVYIDKYSEKVVLVVEVNGMVFYENGYIFFKFKFILDVIILKI